MESKLFIRPAGISPGWRSAAPDHDGRLAVRSNPNDRIQCWHAWNMAKWTARWGPRSLGAKAHSTFARLDPRPLW